jgi:hypothetical protein
MITMKKLLLTTACMMALVAPGHANFSIRGVNVWTYGNE